MNWKVKMKVIGFLQVRNEVSTGHLNRFIERNLDLFDKLYVFDDASTDGTDRIIEKHATVLIRSQDSKFSSELEIKSELLQRVQAECDEGDAILRLDADEILYASKEELIQLIHESFALGFDSISLPHRNLWRSTSFFRLDDGYNDFRPARIWKLSKQLNFPRSFGLHVTSDPQGLTATRKVDKFPVVHFGFASTELILQKYESYRQHWLTGYALNRMINENGLRLERLSFEKEELGARFLELHENVTVGLEPERLTPLHWRTLTRQVQDEFEESKPQAKVTLASLIYKDLEWLEFQYSQLLKLQTDLPMGQAEILFIANDATPEVLAFLKENLIPHRAISTRAHDGEWFINSVYRAYKKAVEFSETEYVYLVNSDMAYTKGTLSRVFERRAPSLMLASRLVELGVMESGQFGIERSFGSSPKTFRPKDFARFAASIAEPEVKDGGLYMPLLVHRETFLKIGGFPEGNLTPESLETYTSGGAPVFAKQGSPSIPGDRAFVSKAAKQGVLHKTVFDSIAYHFQAGEMRSKSRARKRASGFAIVNNSIAGINKEKVLWGYLVERLSTMGARVQPVSSKFPTGVISSVISPARLWLKTLKSYQRNAEPRVSFSNASYALIPPGKSRKVVFRQDAPADVLNQWIQKLNLSRADSIYANDPSFVESENKRNVQWSPVPLSELWWNQEPEREKKSDAKNVIFVGSFSETKGWPILRELVKSRKDISWTLVSKYANDEHGLGSPNGTNWTVYRKLSQERLRSMVASSDLLIVASPYETQCLAALESLSQDTAVITTPTGFLGGFPVGRHEFGVVSDDLDRDLDLALDSLESFRPRQFIQSLNLIGEDSWDNWDRTLRAELEWSFRDLGKPSSLQSFIDRAVSFVVSQIRLSYRNRLKPTLLMTYRRFAKN
jgi:hypothetical protein